MSEEWILVSEELIRSVRRRERQVIQKAISNGIELFVLNRGGCVVIIRVSACIPHIRIQNHEWKRGALVSGVLYCYDVWIGGVPDKDEIRGRKGVYQGLERLELTAEDCEFDVTGGL